MKYPAIRKKLYAKAFATQGLTTDKGNVWQLARLSLADAIISIVTSANQMETSAHDVASTPPCFESGTIAANHVRQLIDDAIWRLINVRRRMYGTMNAPDFRTDDGKDERACLEYVQESVKR